MPVDFVSAICQELRACGVGMKGLGTNTLDLRSGKARFELEEDGVRNSHFSLGRACWEAQSAEEEVNQNEEEKSSSCALFC